MGVCLGQKDKLDKMLWPAPYYVLKTDVIDDDQLDTENLEARRL